METVKIFGNPTVAGFMVFSLRVTDQASATNGTRTEVRVSVSLDLCWCWTAPAVCFSPTSADPGAPSRWNALKEAVSGFANLYQAIGGTKPAWHRLLRGYHAHTGFHLLRNAQGAVDGAGWLQP